MTTLERSIFHSRDMVEPSVLLEVIKPLPSLAGDVNGVSLHKDVVINNTI